MRFFEIQGGFRMAIDDEERTLIKTAEDSELADDALDAREQEVARKMVTRGLFNRLQRDGKLYYVPNGLQDIWRF